MRPHSGIMLGWGLATELVRRDREIARTKQGFRTTLEIQPMVY